MGDRLRTRCVNIFPYACNSFLFHLVSELIKGAYVYFACAHLLNICHSSLFLLRIPTHRDNVSGWILGSNDYLHCYFFLSLLSSIFLLYTRLVYVKYINNKSKRPKETALKKRRKKTMTNTSAIEEQEENVCYALWCLLSII
jgi:hypothetical protein